MTAETSSRPRYRHLLAVLAAALSAAVFGVAASPASAGTLDQSQTRFNDGLSVGGDFQVGQSFTAGTSGALDQVDLLLRADASCPSIPDLNVQITTVPTDGEPTGTVLASASVPGASAAYLPITWVEVPFTTPAPVSAGTAYGIVASAGLCPDEVGGYTAWVWWSELSDSTDPYAAGMQFVSYDSGATWAESPAYDFAFETYVVPTPAPPVSAPPVLSPAPTGQRAAAIKKCKKKFPGKAKAQRRKKCITKAKKLPV